MRGDAYTVYYYCAKDGCRHSLAVFGVLGRAHDDVVAAGEHAADGAEDYDGEDGDDDAVGCWISGGSRALYIFPAIFLHVASFSIFLSGSSVPCPCVEGGNDGLHGWETEGGSSSTRGAEAGVAEVWRLLSSIAV